MPYNFCLINILNMIPWIASIFSSNYLINIRHPIWRLKFPLQNLIHSTFLFFFGHVTQHVGSQFPTTNQISGPAVKAQTLNHWNTRVSHNFLFSCLWALYTLPALLGSLLFTNRYILISAYGTRETVNQYLLNKWTKT